MEQPVRLFTCAALILLCLAAGGGRCDEDAQHQNEEEDVNRVEWWKKTNYYHIYLRSFKDSNGDGNGDLRGVLEKLDYLEQIGVGTILMAPFYSSPMKDCGYDIDDYLAIEPMFGSMQDFDELVEELHKRQMKIVVDFVPNHSSNKHKWFECSERALLEPERCGRYKDYYVWSDSKRFEGRFPSNWISVFGGGPAWSWSELRQQFYLHQFLPEQPDLNFTNQAVRNEFKEIARFWLRRGADGLRVDSAIYLIEDAQFRDEPQNEKFRLGDDPSERLRHVYTRSLPESAQLVKDWRDVAAEFSPQRVIITEAYDELPKLIEYYGKSAQEKLADLPFNFELFKLNSENIMRANYVEQVVENWLNATRSLSWPDERGAMSPWIIWVTGNHDNSRLANRIGLQRVPIFKWITYLAPGAPVNYYGDEIPLHNSNMNSIPERTILEGEPTRLPFRAPIAWSADEPSGGFSASKDTWMPLNADYKTNNIEKLLASEQNDNQLKLFVRMQQLRNEHLPLFVFGDLVFFQNQPEQDNAILAMGRTHPKFGNLLLVANLSPLTHERRSIRLKPAALSRVRQLELSAPKRGKVVLAIGGASSPDTHKAIAGDEIELDSLSLGGSQALLIKY